VRFTLGAAAAAGLAITSGVYAEEPVRGVNVGTVGNWNLVATTDQKSRRLAHCVAVTMNNSGAWSFIVTREYRWAMTLASPLFITQDPAVRLRIAVDESDSETVAARVLTVGSAGGVAEIDLPSDGKLLKRLMRGNVLRISLGDRTSNYDLQDTSKVLSELLKCVRDKLNPESSQAQGGSRSRGGLEPDLRSEITSLAANLLSEAGVTGFRINPSKDSKTSVSWTAPNGSGVLMVVLDQRVKQPSDLTPRLISIAAEKCKGKFVSGAMPEEKGAARVFSSCQVGTGEPHTAYYSTIRRSAGGHYVIMTVPPVAAATAPADEPDKHIREAAYRVLK